MSDARPDPRRRTPRVDVVLADETVASAVGRLGRSLVKGTVAAVLADCRAGRIAPDEVVSAVLARLPESATTLRSVINATGIVVHTNLGRAPLSDAAVDAVRTAAGATDVELDLDTGRRGPRGRGALAALAAAVPDAGGVHVVNNGAAALALTAVALTSADINEVVIARGELVEIGDGFRIPELMESLGVTLREVGTTNRVSAADYEAAVGARTAFLLKVHPSNFKVEGFTSAVSIAALAELSARTAQFLTRPVPLVADIGSGLLAAHKLLPDEPDASTALRSGADLVTASGDKLLGGPQCGVLLGDEGLVHRLRRHPFARAVRVDKLTLAALEATLVGPPPPVVQALARRPEDLMARARRLAMAIGPQVAQAVASEGHVGGGGAPGVPLESAAVALPASYAEQLRTGEPSVVGHVHDGHLHLDLLTVPEDLDEVLAGVVRRVARERAAG